MHETGGRAVGCEAGTGCLCGLRAQLTQTLKIKKTRPEVATLASMMKPSMPSSVSRKLAAGGTE
jgi:hypothetical protein